MPQAAHAFDTPDLPNVTAQPGRPRTRSDTHTSPAGETVPHHECTAECRLLPSGSRGWLGAVARCPPDVRKVWKLQIPSTVHTVNTLKNHTLNHLRSGAICTAIYWIFKKMSHKLQFPGESKVGGNVTEKQWSPPGHGPQSEHQVLVPALRLVARASTNNGQGHDCSSSRSGKTGRSSED